MQLSRLPPTLLPSLPPQRPPRRMKEGDERVVGKERWKENGGWDLKPLEIWESIVKPWINLSIKGRRERTRIIRICKRAACPAYRLRLSIFPPCLATVAGNKVERSIPTFTAKSATFVRYINTGFRFRRRIKLHAPLF